MRKLIAVSLLALATCAFASTGEVTLSGSTWTGKVDGTTKYTGSDMFAACNACINAMTSGGTVNLRNSGNSGSSGGVNKAILLDDNITFNGNNCTVNINSGDQNIISFWATGKNNVGVSNVKITSSSGQDRYGVWFRGCTGQNLQNSSAANVDNGCFRSDNSTGPTGNITVGTLTGTASASARESHALKTDNQSGYQRVTTINGTDLGGCGLMWNTEPSSVSSTCTTVNGTRCGVGQGYAAFRVANSNGKASVGTVNSSGSCHGFFSCSGSYGTTITTLNVSGSTSQGCLLQTCNNTTINGGYIHGSSGGNPLRIAATALHNVVNGIDFTGSGVAVLETSGGDYNTIENCKLHGMTISLSGAHSTSVNNTP